MNSSHHKFFKLSPIECVMWIKVEAKQKIGPQKANGADCHKTLFLSQKGAQLVFWPKAPDLMRWCGLGVQGLKTQQMPIMLKFHDVNLVDVWHTMMKSVKICICFVILWWKTSLKYIETNLSRFEILCHQIWFFQSSWGFIKTFQQLHWSNAVNQSQKYVLYHY